MRLAINEVKADPAYAQLSQETRTRIDAVFQSLKDAESAEASLAATPDLVTPPTEPAA